MGVCLFIMGRQRAGKDTSADYLVRHYGFQKGQLAGPVYAVARDVFGMQGKDRGLLIQIGVKLREIDPLVLPKALWRRAVGGGPGSENEPLPEGLRLVITDARFPNEWEFFKSRGGVALRIVASQAVRSTRPGYHAQFEHDPTETGLDHAPADAEIVNEGTLEELHAALDRLAQETLQLSRLGG